MFAITYGRQGCVTVHRTDCVLLLAAKDGKPPCKTARSLTEAQAMAAELVWPPDREAELCGRCRPERR